jgi:hypothetical protein
LPLSRLSGRFHEAPAVIVPTKAIISDSGPARSPPRGSCSVRSSASGPDAQLLLLGAFCGSTRPMSCCRPLGRSAHPRVRQRRRQCCSKPAAYTSREGAHPYSHSDQRLLGIQSPTGSRRRLSPFPERNPRHARPSRTARHRVRNRLLGRRGSFSRHRQLQPPSTQGAPACLSVETRVKASGRLRAVCLQSGMSSLPPHHRGWLFSVGSGATFRTLGFGIGRIGCGGLFHSELRLPPSSILVRRRAPGSRRAVSQRRG